MIKKDELEKYLPYLNEYEMSHQQKMEYLDAVNLIVTSFVDLAFDPDADSILKKFVDDAEQGKAEA